MDRLKRMRGRRLDRMRTRGGQGGARQVEDSRRPGRG